MTQQNQVSDCVRKHFGGSSLCDPHERSMRFLEEAFELCQTAGLTKKDVVKLAKYVFARPVGEQSQEIGGVGVTLYALAEALRWDADRCVSDEIKRFTDLPSDYFRARHEVKYKAGVSTVSTEK